MQSKSANEMSRASGKYTQMILRLRIGVGHRKSRELQYGLAGLGVTYALQENTE